MVTVELDAELAARAKANLAAAGVAPTVVVGDGEDGTPLAYLDPDNSTWYGVIEWQETETGL